MLNLWWKLKRYRRRSKEWNSHPRVNWRGYGFELLHPGNFRGFGWNFTNVHGTNKVPFIKSQASSTPFLMFTINLYIQHYMSPIDVSLFWLVLTILVYQVHSELLLLPHESHNMLQILVLTTVYIHAIEVKGAKRMPLKRGVVYAETIYFLCEKIAK